MVRHEKKFGAPDDYDELYREYNDLVIATLVSMGLLPQDAVDSAHNLFAKFMEKDGLSWYDPTIMFQIGTVNQRKVTLKPGENPPEGFVKTGERPAAFMAMFKSWMKLSALGERDRVQTKYRREILEWIQAGDDNGGWGQVVASLTESSVQSDALSFAEEVVLRESFLAASEELAARAEEHKVAGSNRDLSRLLGRIERMVEEEGKINRKALAQELGVSAAHLARQLAELRAYLADRGLSPKEVVA